MLSGRIAAQSLPRLLRLLVCLVAGGTTLACSMAGLDLGQESALATPPRATPWPTPPLVACFVRPLPEGAFGPYVQGVTGPLRSDTRYGVQNPAWGNEGNCFRDAQGHRVPFRMLYHAGVDLFRFDEEGAFIGREGAGFPVQAVADGLVTFVQDAGSDGHIVILEHRLVPELAEEYGPSIYSVYWHVAQVDVAPGQVVRQGQALAVIHDQGHNSHLHWEMHTFRDGSDLFPSGTAGARGTCNGRFAGVGYTWDDDSAWTHPDAYGYLDPIALVETCVGRESAD